MENNLAAETHFLPQSSSDQKEYYEYSRSVSAKEFSGDLEFCQNNVLCCIYKFALS